MMNLVELKQGMSARVVSIDAGESAQRKLENMGVRQDIVVRKIAGFFRRGPLVIVVGSSQIALGRGMAAKVKVEPL